MEPSARPTFINALRGLDSETLFEAAENVRSLVAHPGWGFVGQLLEDARERDLGRLDSRVYEHAEYASLAATIGSYGMAASAAQAVLEAAAARVTQLREMEATRG